VAIGKNAAVRRQLRTLFDLGAVRELTDGQLLERFATDRGEAAELAFAALVERHGPMVLRVCRGVLGDAHEAQDAFQATFLVLVKRARRLWVRDSLGPWLHQVAYRTASCDRAAAARRSRLERRAAMTVREAPPERDFDLERLLHEEIERLPERYRVPVVLCDLEGQTHEQAARHLGWPVGTIKSRLSRARERLRARLLRRGVGADAGPLAVAGLFKAPSLTIPPALLDATTAAAARYAAIGSAARGSAVLLAEGVLRTMSMTQWWKVATVLLVAGATASGVEWLGGGIGPGAQVPAARQDQEVRAGGAPTQEVKPGKLRLTLRERGYVEAARTEDVYCNVEKGTTIIKIVPEGAAVKRGEVIAELDSAALRDQLVNQRITTKAAEANFLNAKLMREVAEVAAAEYEEVFRQDDEALKGAIEGARAARRKAQERLDRTRAARERLAGMQRTAGGAQTLAEAVDELDLQDRIDEAELTLDRERRSLTQAEGKRELLRKYTYPKTRRELQSAVEKAHSDELARQAAWELAKIKEDKLEKQIANCTLVAPVNGCVLYANDRSRALRGLAQIEEGATVRERQKIVSIVDFNDPMQVNVKVPESLIDQVVPRMKALIRIDAFPGQTFAGLVAEVAPLPDPGSSFQGDVKVYTTRIRMGGGRPNLRPGMTADATIVLDDREDAIGVPAKAVARYDGKDHVAVKWPGGRIEWREVVLGASDGSIVEVKEGLHSGEQVVLEAEPLLTDEQRARRDAVVDPLREKSAPPRKAPVRKGQGKPARPPR
jgi:RND family efflux transporter MFP subunit